jgi:ubiquinone/menaquinone biosynthesis C-methylase UbiE
MGRQEEMIDRRWQNWDVGDVAQTIEAIWQASANEAQHRDRVGELLASFMGQERCSLLEVGCGTGEIYRRFVPKLIPNDSYTGVDVSERMLEIASGKFPEAKFLQADGYALPFEAASFDFVVSFEVLGHLPSIDEFLVELLRVTKEYCIFSIWGTEGASVVTVETTIGDVPFLQREFPRAHVEEAVRKAAPDTSLQIQTIDLPNKVVVFVVQKTTPTVP